MSENDENRPLTNTTQDPTEIETIEDLTDSTELSVVAEEQTYPPIVHTTELQQLVQKQLDDKNKNASDSKV